MGYKRCLEDLWNLLHKMTCGVDEIHCKVDIGKSMYNLNPWIKMFFKYPSSIAYTSPGWINSLGYRELVKWIIWCTKYMKLYSRKVNNRGDLKSKWKLRYALAKIWSKWFMWTHGDIICWKVVLLHEFDWWSQQKHLRLHVEEINVIHILLGIEKLLRPLNLVKI